MMFNLFPLTKHLQLLPTELFDHCFQIITEHERARIRM